MHTKYIYALFLIVLFFFVQIVGGCSYRQEYTNYIITQLTVGNYIADDSTIYCSMPQDSIQDEKHVEGLGAEAQEALMKGLAQHAGKTVFASEPQLSLKESLEAARKADCAYLINLAIMHWEDHPAFFEHSDRAEVVLHIYSVTSGEILRSDRVECSGKATQIYHLGSYSPGDCLAPAFEGWAKTVFVQR